MLVSQGRSARRSALLPSIVREPHRVARLPAALRRRAGIEDLKAVVAARAAGCASGRRSPRPRRGSAGASGSAGPAAAPASWTIPIRTSPNSTVALQRQPHDQLVRVHVPADRVHRRAERLQLLQDLELHEVAGVQDRVGVLSRRRSVRQPPVPARHVRVGDDRDDHTSRGASASATSASAIHAGAPKIPPATTNTAASGDVGTRHGPKPTAVPHDPCPTFRQR